MNPRPLHHAIAPLLTALALMLSTPVRAALPGAVAEALRHASIPESAVSLWVQPVGATAPTLTHRANEARNPASVMKLLTSFAALDLLGPAYTWKTEALTSRAPADGILEGDLILRGGGDPFLTWDRFGGLLRELRDRGVRDIHGDLIVDRSRFVPQEAGSSLDGRYARAYNATPDALLLNFNAITLRLAASGDTPPTAQATLPFAELKIDNRLKASPSPCGDWKSQVAPEIAASGATLQVSLPGRYPTACGEKMLNLASPDANAQIGGIFRALWSELGGHLRGRVRAGTTPADARLLVSWESPPLAEILRETDKFSNNVMARQIFLTLGMNGDAPASAERAITRIQQWMPSRGLDPSQWALENGSGLSRQERTTAAQLGALLLAAWKSPRMPEFVSAQPVIGVDGTMKKRLPDTPIAGHGYVKTGTLDGVKTAAGFVQDAKGRWIAFAWLINHANAEGGEAALEQVLTGLYGSP